MREDGEMMHEPTRDSIRKLTDDASFVRGMGYLVEGRVYDALLADGRLTGRSVGSMDFDYEMEIVLGPVGVESGRCTCPRGGFCKHLVALALLLIERPEEVVRIDREELAERLRGHDADELVGLMVDQAMEDAGFARRLLEVIRPEGEPAVAPPALEATFSTLVATFRRQAEAAAPSWPANRYRAGHEYAAAIQQLLMRAARDSVSNPARLLAVYTGIYQGVESSMDQIDDSDGAAAGAAWDCVAGMQAIVGRAEINSAVRMQWLEMVVPLYLENDYGLGDGLGEAILQTGSTNEVGAAIDLLRSRVSEPLRQPDSDPEGEPANRSSAWSYHYRTMIGCELIADLLRQSGRDDEIDALYLEAGLDYHYVLHRIALSDPERALEHALNYLRDGYDVKRAAQAFLDAGMTAEARDFLDRVVPLLEVRIPHRPDILAMWATVCERGGHPDRALELRYMAFLEVPSVETYRAVMETATEVGRADEYDRKMVDALGKEDRELRVLTEIHIHRRDVDAAIDAFERITGYRGDELALRLATVATKRRPDASRRLITDVVERQIAMKNRMHYAQAAAVAGRLRDIMTGQEFARYLSDLRLRYRRLPALQDELNRAFGR